MYIEVEGISYFISIRATEKKVSVLGYKDGAIHLAVGAQVSQDELYSLLRSRTFINSTKKTTHKIDELQNVNLFEQQYTIVLTPHIDLPYCSGKTIYSPQKQHSTTALNKLKEQLLLQAIKQHISFWEEHLNVLINEINLRNLSVNFYKANSKGNTLTFNKKLYNRSKTFLAYVCATACFDFVGLSNEERDYYGQAHIVDWKQQQRIVNFELRR